MAPKIKLTYFEFRARGEIIRILLHYGGLQFEDKKIKREEWPEFKPSRSLYFVVRCQQRCKNFVTETKFGFMPELEWDGVTLTESVAITRFVAKKLKLVGNTDIEEAQCDAVVDVCSEFIEGMKDYRGRHVQVYGTGLH